MSKGNRIRQERKSGERAANGRLSKIPLMEKELLNIKRHKGKSIHNIPNRFNDNAYRKPISTSRNKKRTSGRKIYHQIIKTLIDNDGKTISFEAFGKLKVADKRKYRIEIRDIKKVLL